jgi:tyrosyl-tRNA synthetase
MGGGTGLIGDPAGKSAERTLQTRDTVAHHVERIKRIFTSVIDFSPNLSNRAVMVNNLDWLGSISYLDMLRDVGKHFSVNMMIQKDSVRERLNNRDQGISYTEFSYMILQAYDFLHLFQKEGVTLQMGGSDQFGNIVVGIDLIGKSNPAAQGTSHAFGLTWPLVTKADGGKFGKTESGAIWLTAERTSPYAYYQFWLNAADADVERFLRIYTFLSLDEIAATLAEHAKDPGQRVAQRTLAQEATRILHGSTEVERAEAAARALFSGEIANLPGAMLREIFADVPSSNHAKATLSGEGVALLDALIATNLAQSKREAREFLQNGSVTVNGRKVGADDRLKVSDLLEGDVIALRRGKKNWHLTRWA